MESARADAVRIRFFCRIVSDRRARRWRSRSCWSLRILLSTAPSRLLATIAPCWTQGVLVEENPTGERVARVAELDASVFVLVDTATFANQSKRLGPGLHEVDDPFVVEGQILRELALLLPGEGQVEILVVADRSVRIVTALRLARETLVVVGLEIPAGRHCQPRALKDLATAAPSPAGPGASGEHVRPDPWA